MYILYMSLKNDKISPRSRILAAASALFYEKGLEETTFAAIAKHAKTSQPSIYIHFKNKMDLLKYVCLEAAECGRNFIDARINPQAPAPARFASYLEGNLDFFRTKKIQAHSLMALYYFAASSKEIETIFNLVQQTGLQRIETFLIQGNYEHSYAIENTEDKARLIHSILVGDCYKVIYAKTESDAKKIKRSSLESIEKIVQPTAALPQG